MNTVQNHAVVNTVYGRLEGLFQNGIYAFRGVPYAAPPVGRLRWQPPQPLQPWTGIRTALEYGPISIQDTMPVAAPGAPDFSNQPQSEDCLYLNVWTPGLDNARRPVMVWIHGGAFIIGSGSEGFLDKGNLSRRGNVVLVSLNYRLGATGFLNLKETTRGRIPASGNEGLLDQVAALEWVLRNIAVFGGDPHNITIFGFSAGGMSVGTLLALPAARGKFHKAINRSGAANVVGTLSSAVDISRLYLKTLNVKEDDPAGLYNLTSRQLLDAQRQLGLQLRQSENRATPFQPIVDGMIIPEFPIISLRKGVAKNIPVLAGNTLDELKFTNAMDPGLKNLDEAGLVVRLQKLIPASLVPGILSIYRDFLSRRAVSSSPSSVLGSITTDLMFRIPTLNLVEAQRSVGAPAFNYLFTYPSPALGGALGAMHGLDNPLLFGAPDPGFTGDSPAVIKLSQQIMDSVAAFARSGDPSCPSLGRWPVYGTDRQTMVLDTPARLESAPFETERRAWDQYDVLNTRPI
jgi:para-nitrobenzyl esterase